MQIGDLIRTAREAKGLDQKTLGQMLGVSGGAVGNWERGGRIAEDNWATLVPLLGIDPTLIPEDVIAAQVGRPSRGAAMGAARGAKVGRVVSIGGRPAPVTLRRPLEEYQKPLEGEVMRFAKYVRRVRHGAPIAEFYNRLLEELAEDYRSGLSCSLDLTGFEYPFDYVSNKVVGSIDLGNLAYKEPPNAGGGPMRFAAMRLWKIAVARQFFAPQVSQTVRFVLFAYIEPEFFASRLVQRAAFEARLLGIDLIQFNDASHLASLIGKLEANESLEPTLQEEEDDLW